MGLKVWLPLNGTLENKGVLPLTSPNNVGSVINSNGKIGSCYSFNGSNQRIEFTHDKTVWSNKEISICMWYKYIEGNTTNVMVDIAADLCLSYTYSSSQVRFNYWRAYSNNGTRTGDSGSGNYYDASKWHHVVLTCDHNINKIYVDGILDVTFDRSSKYTTNWTPLLGANYNKIMLAKSGGSNPYGSGYLNDVRIYDHCLSAAEVREISQGLVLHYKFDQIDGTRIIDSSGYGYNGTIVGTPTLENNSGRYSSCIYMNNTSTSNHIELSGTFPFTNPLTVSFWMKGSVLTNQVLFASPQIEFGTLNSLGYTNPSNAAGFAISTLFKANSWNHICAIRDNTTYTLYVNGIAAAQTGANNYYMHNKSQLWLLNRSYNNSYAANTRISDFRIYCTALSENDILTLYHTGAKIDNKQNLHTFEIIETNSNLFAGKVWTNGYANKDPLTAPFTNFNAENEYQFTTNGASAGSEYININPTGHTYEYDYTISVNAGNQLYIGFERYDANKTSRSNNACIYTYASKSSTDIVKKHFTGTVNLSTDGVNPCKYIRLRILNGWSGTTSGVTGTATIHNFSLREIGTKQKQQINKHGQAIIEEIVEYNNTKIRKNGILESHEFIEL